MTVLRRTLAVLAALVLTVGAANAGETIHIEYHWGGLGPRLSESYDIVRDGDHYKASLVAITAAFGTADRNDRIERSSYDLPPAAIDALIKALREPAMTKAEALAALTRPQWLKDESAAAYASITATPCADSARQLFFRRFQDERVARAALDNYFTGMWTDDYPWASVQVDLPQTGKIERRTNSQKAFMLPWRNGKREDWNPTLGSAVAGLLPETSSGRGRLLGADLVSQLANYVLSGARREWGNLEQSCIFRDVIAKIDPPYKVVGIYNSSGSFNAYLQSAGMPANLALNASLPADESAKVKPAEIEALLRLGPIYTRQVQAFVLKHPKTRFTVWYTERHSFDAQDLDRHDNKALERLRPIAADCVLLREHDFYNGRQWVVTPDGKAFLLNDRPKWDQRREGPGW